MALLDFKSRHRWLSSTVGSTPTSPRQPFIHKDLQDSLECLCWFRNLWNPPVSALYVSRKSKTISKDLQGYRTISKSLADSISENIKLLINISKYPKLFQNYQNWISGPVGVDRLKVHSSLKPYSSHKTRKYLILQAYPMEQYLWHHIREKCDIIVLPVWKWDKSTL